MNILGNLLDWIKLPPRLFFAIALIAGLLLFAPSSILGSLGVSPFVIQYRPIIGGIFLVSSLLFLVHPLASISTFLGEILAGRLNQRANLKWLQTLTVEEKAVLRGYMQKGTQSQMLDPMSGVTSGLAIKGIIYQAANIGMLGYGFAYNIQPWAWDHLNKHPELWE